MMRPIVAFSLVALSLVVLLAGGCKESDPLYCTDDAECQDPAAERYDPATPRCNALGNFCFDGCKRDADCQAAGTPRYEGAGKTRCNTASGHCEGSGGVDGGADFGTDVALGQPCGKDANCASGFCADGVCCADACDGNCHSCALAGKEGTCELVPEGQDPRGQCAGSAASCAGSCDGLGGCKFPGDEQDCGAASCSGEQLTRKACDGQGDCKTKQQSCSGYLCADASGCKTSCADSDDCAGSAQCDQKKCVDQRPDGQPCGDNDALCLSGHCEDGLCCGAVCGTCMRCNKSGSEGTCTAEDAGLAENGECPTDPGCGTGKCNGSGACDYQPAATVCKNVCSVGSQTTSTCDGQGSCQAGSPTSCGFITCDAAGEKCRPGCTVHSECVANSTCDRSAAHVTGLGTCIDPSKVTKVSANLQGAIDALGAKTHLLVAAGTYNESLDTGSKSLTIIADGGVKIAPGVGNNPGLRLQGGATVSIQGVEILSAAGGSQANGITCGDLSNQTTLTVVESTIKSNEGVGVSGTNCDVTLRRNIIQSNQAGGVKLSDGKFVLVNNLIRDNGSSSSGFGGAQLTGIQQGSLFINNTVFKNRFSGTMGGGAICAPALDVVNSIFWGNDGTELATCTPKFSDVEGGGTADGNIVGDPQFNDVLQSDFTLKSTSPCIDKGTDTGVDTALDLANGPRKKGAAVDMGAYEAQ